MTPLSDRLRPMQPWVEALCWVGAAGAIGVATRPWLALVDHAMLVLVGVVAAAARLPRGPSLLAACASVAVFNFLFVPPYYTFAVADLRFAVTFAVMLGVGLLVTDLAHRIRAQAAETARERHAVEVERLRSELLSAVSHDLRTPLASIAGGAEALLGQELGPTQREIAATIHEESARLVRLVTNLLDLTRIASGPPAAQREACPVEEVVASALGHVEATLVGHPVRVDMPREVLIAPMDPTLIEQVLANLLENAAKYSPPGTPIEVSARLDGDAARVEVADRGPGLPPGAEARVFERFFRAADGQRAGGTGLGLAICRAILEVHGGRITARNRDGGGASFTFWLPRAEVAT